MTHADISEVALLIMGAIGVGTLLNRQYKYVSFVSHTAALSDEPPHAVGRTLVLATKIWFSTKFNLADENTLENYKRFRQVINLLAFLVLINFSLLSVVIFALIALLKQTGPQTIIRIEDLALMSGYFAVFIAGYAVTDWLNDAIKDRQLKSVSNGRTREHPSERRAFRVLQPRGDAMRNPTSSANQSITNVSSESKAENIYPALSAAERENIKNDVEAVKQDLIAAGILDESGELKDVYKTP